MKFRNIIYSAGLMACFLVQTVIAGETGTAIKRDDIKAEPFRDAKTVGSLAPGNQVSIVKRDGGWFLLSAPRKGWVKMLSIRRGSTAPAGPKLSGVAALASGRAGTGQVVASTGIRGLNEENLKQSKFNEEELKLAESYTARKQDAAQFAAKAKLKARRVDYLPE